MSSGSTTATTTADCWSTSYTMSDMEAAFFEGGGRGIKEVIPENMPPGRRRMGMPDGSVLYIDEHGNYRIDDADAKVVYRANRNRDFSPYINASDMLARFVEYAGAVGVRRKEVLELPIRLFVSWLVIQAAEADGDAIPEGVTPVHADPAVVSLSHPRCRACNRFIPRLHARHSFPYCNPDHAAFTLSHAA